jgi:hypothetical protein
MKPFFFITGMPRARTAWLATFLSDQGAHCFHDLLARSKDVEAAVETALGADHRAVGISDNGLVYFHERVHGLVPNARWVVVKRDPNECMESAVKCGMGGEWDPWMHAHRADSLATERGALVVDYQDLDARAEEIARWCIPGWVENPDRRDLLCGLDVQMKARDWQKHFASVSSGLAAQVEPFKATRSTSELASIVSEICFGHPLAEQWFWQLIDAADVYDHAIDLDPQNPAQVHRAFEAMCVEWPLNGWFRHYAHVLVPVVSAAMSAWRHDGRGPKSADINSEVINAIAFLIHGQAGVNRWMPRVRELVALARSEDLRRDIK